MSMSEKAKRARREYLRQWRKNNPDRVKKHQETYWERQAEKIANETDKVSKII